MPIYPMPLPTPTQNYFYPAGSGGGGGGTITGATNLGAGAGIFAQVNGANLEFKSLTFTGGVSLIESATEIQISAAGAMFDRTANYVPLGLGAITGDWEHQGSTNFVGAFNVQAGTGDILFQSDTGTITVTAPNPGEIVELIASNVEITGSTNVIVQGSTFNFNSTGVSAHTAGVSFDVFSPIVRLDGIAQATTANTLYYDSVTKQVTWDAAPSGGSDWNLSGTNSGAGLLFGTNAAFGWQYQVNSVPFASVSTSGDTSYSGGLFANGQFEVHSPEHVIVQTNNGSAKDITIEADRFLNLRSTTSGISGNSVGNTAFVAGGTFNATCTDFVADASNSANVLGNRDVLIRAYTEDVVIDSLARDILQIAAVNWHVTAASYKLLTLPAATSTDIVYFDSVTKALSYGPVSALTSGVWKEDGSNSGASLAFGTNTAEGWSYQVNSVAFASVSNIGVTTYTNTLNVNAFFNVLSPFGVNIETVPGSNGDVVIDADRFLFLRSSDPGGNIQLQSSSGIICSGPASFNVSCANFVVNDTGNSSITTTNSIALVSTAAAQTISLNAAGTGSGIVLTSDAYTNFASPLTQFINGSGTVYANVSVLNFNSTNNASFISSTGTTSIGGFSGLILDSTNVTLPNIPSASQTDVLYINPATKQVSYNPVTSLLSGAWKSDGTNSGGSLLLGTNAANGWSYQANSSVFATVSSAGATTYTGGFQANGSFGVNSPTAMTIRTTAASGQGIEMYGDSSLYFEATNSTAEIYCGSHLYLSSDANLQAVTVNNIHLFANQLAILRSVNNNVSLEAVNGNILQSANVDWQVTSPSYKLMTLPASTEASLVYYNSTSKALSYGPVPSSAFPWTVVAGTSQALVAGNGYIATNPALTTFTLPATASVGATFRIACSSAGLFTVAQNAGQSVRLGNSVSTVGAGGSVTATNTGDCLEIVCITANTSFMVVSSVGNFNVV